MILIKKSKLDRRRPLLVGCLLLSSLTLEACEDRASAEGEEQAGGDQNFSSARRQDRGGLERDRSLVPIIDQGGQSLFDRSSADRGGMPDMTPCPPGESLVAGACAPVLCEPSAPTCLGGELYQCDPSGTAVMPALGGCQDRTCIEGECRPIKHNVMILFDTSESMNSCVNESDSYVDCCGDVCPEPWPVCETRENPLSRLGHSKMLFQRFFAEQITQIAGRFALLTFPQTEIPFNNECSSSIYDFSNFITDDERLHETPADWFTANQGEVVRVPFSPSWSMDNTDALLEWVDFEEELGVNQELRATGFTPLGRSMFYAGEYLRHRVIVEGKSCNTDPDCGSQDYVCVEGQCTDPVKDCRLNLLLVFTDGQESTAPLIDQFYNPVVQARRMKFGLSCAADEDCLSGASCEEGHCRRGATQLSPCENDNQCPNDAFCVEGRCTVPGFLWPDDQGRCAEAGNPCIVGAQDNACAGFFEQCLPVDPYFVDQEQGANFLRAHNGDPISVTTHVINVSDQANESQLIASHGGGLHFQVDISETETLLRVLTRIADYKSGGQCALEGNSSGVED
ncbi:MAG: EB domain-containing protein [Myxococcota bacterium]|nr:EB domain-containing protein [Myxococcota bacterium]